MPRLPTGKLANSPSSSTTPWRGKGLASLLFKDLVEAARKQRLRMEGTVLAQNRRMLEFSKTPASRSNLDPDDRTLVKITLDLQESLRLRPEHAQTRHPQAHCRLGQLPPSAPRAKPSFTPPRSPKPTATYGIWYYNQPSNDQYHYKYSGGFATYPQQQGPLAHYEAG
ncbi:MAG: hypothetical protein R2724_33675 [Bryobacterales bacterium]